MRRIPFKLAGAAAQARRPSDRDCTMCRGTGRVGNYTRSCARCNGSGRKFVYTDARASFVWLYGVLIPLAIGETDVEIRRRSPDGPWHKITYSSDEAFDLIREHYPLQRKSLTKLVESHRRKREEVTS